MRASRKIGEANSLRADGVVLVKKNNFRTSIQLARNLHPV